MMCAEKYARMPADKPVCFLDFVSEYRFEIEIPLIQREFAFGREGEKKKRRSFIGDILKVAYGKKESLLLDFLFGTLDEDSGRRRFVPLDGQQRLTVLFLFAWYFAKKTLKPLGIAFRFPMRRMADSFVEHLVEQVNDCRADNPSVWLSRQPWFMPFWKQDATVSGMLTVLDEIHGQTDDSIRGSDEWLKYILFYVKPIPVAEMCTDNAYVKMNARGLPLSKWEKIKAKISESLTLAFDAGDVDDDCMRDWQKGLDGEWREKIEELAYAWLTNEKPKECKDKLRYVIDKADLAWVRLVNAVVALSAGKDLVIDRFVTDKVDVEDYAGVFGDRFLMLFPRVLNAISQNTSVFEYGWTKDRSRNLFWKQCLWSGCQGVNKKDEICDFGVEETLSRSLFRASSSYASILRLYVITRYVEKQLTHGLQEALLTVTRVLNLIDNSSIGKDKFFNVRSAIDAIFDSRDNIPEVKGLNCEQVEEETYKLNLCPGEYIALERNNFLQGSIDLFRYENGSGYSRDLYDFFVASFYADKGGAFDKSDESFRKILISATDGTFEKGDLIYPQIDSERWLRLFRSKAGRQAFRNMVAKVTRDDKDQKWGVVNAVFDDLNGDRISIRSGHLFFFTRDSWTKTARRVSYKNQEQRNIDLCEEWVRKYTEVLTLKERKGDEKLYLNVKELGNENPRVYRKGEDGDVCVGTLVEGKVSFVDCDCSSLQIDQQSSGSGAL